MIYRFGDYELDDELFELRHEGNRLPAEAKVVDVLLHLIRNRHRVVSKTELLETVWHDVVVRDRIVDQAVYTARRLLKDDANTPWAIQTVRGRGHRWIALVVESSRRSSRRSLPPGEVNFIGRKAQMSALEEAFDHASSGTLAVALVSGEAGIGKTRLLLEFAERVKQHGATTLVGRCSEVDGAPPFWPWIQLYRSLGKALEPDKLRTLAARHPEADRVLSGEPPAKRRKTTTNIALGSAQFRILEALSQLWLDEAVSPPTLILVLDDLHRADPSSLGLFSHLATQSSQNCLLIAGAARSGELAAQGPLNQLHGEVQRAGGLVVALGPLSRSESDEFLQLRRGRPLEEPHLCRLYEASGGNPLILSAVSDAEIGGPRSADGAVDCLLERLPTETLRALSICSVSGRIFRPELLARCTGATLDSLLASLEPAMQRGLLRESEATPGCLEFRHVLIRDRAYSQLATLRRQQLHGALAESLISSLTSRESALEIAEHLLASRAVPEKARFYFREAAIDALERGALPEAAETAARALALPRPSGIQDDQFRLLLTQGRALCSSGRQDAGIAALVEALAQARTPDDVYQVGDAVAPGFLSIQAGLWKPEATALLEEALSRLPAGASAAYSLLAARLGLSLYWCPGAGERRADLIESGLRRSRRLASPTRSAVRILAEGASWCPDSLASRLELSPELLKQSEQHGDLAFVGKVFRIASLVEAARMEEVEAEVIALEAVAAKNHDPAYLWYAGIFRSMLCLQRGDFEGASRELKRWSPAGRALDDKNALHVGAVSALTIKHLRGDYQGIEEVFSLISGEFPLVRAWRSPWALFRLHAGDKTGARRLVAEIMAEITTWQRDIVWLAGVSSLGDAVAELNDEQWSEAVLRLLKPYRGRLAVVGYGISTWGSVDRIVGKLAASLGAWDLALECFEASAELERRARLSPWLVLTTRAHARALRVCGRSRDMRQQEALHTDAARLGAAMGMSLRVI